MMEIFLHNLARCLRGMSCKICKLIFLLDRNLARNYFLAKTMNFISCTFYASCKILHYLVSTCKLVLYGIYILPLPPPPPPPPRAYCLSARGWPPSPPFLAAPAPRPRWCFSRHAPASPPAPPPRAVAHFKINHLAAVRVCPKRTAHAQGLRLPTPRFQIKLARCGFL